MALVRRLLLLGKGGAAKPLNPSDTYFDSGPGTIWIVRNGSYFDHVGGTGYIWDIPSDRSGAYFDRS